MNRMNPDEFELDEFANVDISSKLFVSLAEHVLSLIDVGHAPETRQAAHMLHLPFAYLERQLKSQTLRQFVRRGARKRR